jgi:hypothetical protein
MSKLGAMGSKSLEKIESVKTIEHGLDVKEVGFLLRMIDDMSHSGKVLELALQVKLKLQHKLNLLIENKELI